MALERLGGDAPQLRCSSSRTRPSASGGRRPGCAASRFSAPCRASGSGGRRRHRSARRRRPSADSLTYSLAGASSAVLGVALAQEARQLGGERVAGREVLVLLDRARRRGARAPRRRPRSPRRSRPPRSPARRRLAPASSSSCVSISTPSSSPSRSQSAQRGARARRERDVVRHGRPQARRRDARRAGTRRGARRRCRSAPRSATAARPSSLDQLRSSRLPVTGAGRVCGTSASSEPSVTTSSTPRSLREADDELENVRQRRFGSIAEQQHDVAAEPGDRRVVEGVLGPVDLARQRPRRA